MNTRSLVKWVSIFPLGTHTTKTEGSWHKILFIHFEQRGVMVGQVDCICETAPRVFQVIDWKYSAIFHEFCFSCQRSFGF